MGWFKFTTGFTPIELGDHSTRHENDGDDEISVEGLSGLLANDQHVLDAELDIATFHNGLVDGGVIGAMGKAMDYLDIDLDGGAL